MASAIEVRTRVTADLKSLFLALSKLIPGERLEAAMLRIDVVLKFRSPRDVIGADKQRYRNTRVFNDRAKVDEVVAIAVIERQHYCRRFHIICSQHLDRVTQRDKVVVLLQELDMFQEMFR